MRQKTNIDRPSNRNNLSTVLLSAELLTPDQIKAATPQKDQPTWGVLETALSIKDEAPLSSSMDSFALVLDQTEQSSFTNRDQAEAAAVLAMSNLYLQRLRNEKISQDDMIAAANRLQQIRNILKDSPFQEADSYAFELETLEELLRHGYLSFMSSSREENSQLPEVNSDLYLFSETTRQKIPISVKLGAKKSTHYTHGIRSVSRKDWQRKNMPFIDYLRYRVPEIN